MVAQDPNVSMSENASVNVNDRGMQKGRGIETEIEVCEVEMEVGMERGEVEIGSLNGIVVMVVVLGEVIEDLVVRPGLAISGVMDDMITEVHRLEMDRIHMLMVLREVAVEVGKIKECMMMDGVDHMDRDQVGEGMDLGQVLVVVEEGINTILEDNL